MIAQLSAIVEDLQSVERRVHGLHRSVPREVWCHRPGPGRWSPAECVAHLNLTSTAALPLLKTGLREAAMGAKGPVSTYRRDVVGWVIWKLIAPANGLRTQTHRSFIPAQDEPVEAVMSDYGRLQSEIIAAVRAADGLPIHRVMVRSPFDARIRCNLYAMLTLIPRHQARHALQAERAVRLAVPELSPLTV